MANDVIEKAISWALSIANNPANGYDQLHRWGPDYDCSSFVISAFEQAGVKVKTAGATYTGNMKAVFLKCGFADVTGSVNLASGAGLIRGDVLLNEVTHTALYLGSGQIVHAAGNENGGATGGASGDQNGREICQRGYYNSPWNCVLRFSAAKENNSDSSVSVNVPVLRNGSVGGSVVLLQIILNGLRFNCGDVDGDFGPKTENALRKFQAVMGINQTGVADSATWKVLFGG